MTKLLPFQREFLKAVENPKYDTVAISGPRTLGKTFIAAKVLIRCMTPGDSLHQPGKEYILGAASLEQARLTYSFIREALEPTGEYRWVDSTTRLGATHKASNTKLRAISSNAKTSFGLVNVPIVVIDEPGALEIVGGQMLSDSLFTAQGKVGSRLKLRSGRRRSTKQAPEKADDPAFAPPPTLTRNQTLPQKRRSFLIVMVPPGTIKPSIRHPQQETSKCPTSSTH